MIKRRSLLVGVATTSIVPRIGLAAGYPDRPIRLVVPYAPGGATDTGARALGERLEKILGQSIVVENKAGGSTIIGTETVAKAKPDGYTLLLAPGALAVNAAFGIALPYNTFKDLAPVARFFDMPILLAASNDAPFKSMQELLATAKAGGPSIPFATAGAGSIQHLWAEYLKTRTGLNLDHVSYKGSSEALRDVVGGHVPLLSDLLMPTATAVRAGKVRGLVVAMPQRSALLPDVPTVGEVGLAGMEGAVPFGVMAPAGVSPEIVARLNAAINDVLHDGGFRDRLAEFGFTLIGGTPDFYAQTLADESAKWRKVIQDAHIPPPA
ncbi:Tripartite-type tricarboxylate transporter, receptor component TctC [Enhydrobacter aerosaccus]|uniref:Tripartite-type tricarboxylate transporter, receptor component TctC n=1 Tax=Enhydrobacter aerosaccus TaxID=225324 RepID=A0A1T4T573_9HYPH|nr:tripartite tricarboxylate transporter substrate binding protein [Enhydrobacter aerosaccus]SKA35596.1 Tripartite-type tricarboxylate transporter, receptor component TctC [Enhydrobacter aerosaccus]